MFEKFLSANAENFRQRYEGTFGFYKDESGRRLLVKLSAIRDNRCTFIDATGIEYRLNPDAERDIGFEFLPPKSAWYNTPQGALWTQRIAQRQFQRGVTAKNLSVSLLLKGALIDKRTDFAILSAIYEGQHTPEELLRNLKDGMSIAISSQFALDERGQVWLFREHIGSYKRPKDSKFVFTLKEPQLWRTEITDALAALECSAEIA